MSAFWEPWQPQVGDRVRLLSRGECPMHSELSETLHGTTGTVAELDPDEPRGHGVRVTVDRVDLLPAAWMVDFGPWCAVLELDPVS